ncbi:Arm DNA-binding domain-containing protein [Maribacter sp. R77961]|uniref:Arm DNA-binding domain-containing protein n=1 Tax=Maribacter sp. R77961 TaxID=3093871 RepID=UPI0037C8CFE0
MFNLPVGRQAQKTRIIRNNSTLTVLIFTRDITNNPEKLTIYARITVDGRRAEISLKRYTSVNVWDVSKGSLQLVQLD